MLVQLGVAVRHAARGEVGFEPDDGFDSGSPGGVVELDRAEHGAVVGQGDGIHPHGLGSRDELLDIAEAVQQGVGGMDVQVDKGHG